MKAQKTNVLLTGAILAFGGMNAIAGTVYYSDAEVAGFAANASPGLFFVNEDYEPNGLSATSSGSSGGITGSGYADLSTGKLGIQSTGNIPTIDGAISQTFAIADLADTITATGATAGLNLGLNLTVNGSSSFSDPSQNVTFVAVGIFQPGTFDLSTQSAQLANLVFGEGFVVGPGTLDYTSYFSNFGIAYGGTYGSGTQTIPLNIPFATLGSNFQLEVALETYEVGDASTGSTWNVDYSHTLNVALDAPTGVTLTSGSSVLPGTTSSTPEPGSLVLLAGGVLALGVFRFGRTSVCS